MLGLSFTDERDIQPADCGKGAQRAPILRVTQEYRQLCVLSMEPMCISFLLHALKNQGLPPMLLLTSGGRVSIAFLWVIKSQLKEIQSRHWPLVAMPSQASW